MGETVELGDTWKVGSIVKERPMIKFSPSGTPWTKFSLSVQPRAPKDAPADAPKPEKVFYEVTAFKKLAEHFCQDFEKGDRIIVAGRAQIETWTGTDGQERKTKKIIAEAGGPEMTFAGADIHRGERSTAAAPQQSSVTAQATADLEAPF